MPLNVALRSKKRKGNRGGDGNAEAGATPNKRASSVSTVGSRGRPYRIEIPKVSHLIYLNLMFLTIFPFRFFFFTCYFRYRSGILSKTSRSCPSFTVPSSRVNMKRWKKFPNHRNTNQPQPTSWGGELKIFFFHLLSNCFVVVVLLYILLLITVHCCCC